MTWPKEIINRVRWRDRHPAVARLAARQARWKQRGLKKADGSQFTQVDYDQLANMQMGVCALCAEPPGSRMLDTDHDHETGIVRGLLCHNCNKALGAFDNKRSIDNLMNYLGAR